MHASVKLFLCCLAYLAGILLASAGFFDSYIIFVRDWLPIILLASAWILVTVLFWLRGRNKALFLLLPVALGLGISMYLSHLYPKLTDGHIGYWIYQEEPIYHIWGTVRSEPKKKGSIQELSLGDISLDSSGKSLTGSLLLELPASYHLQYGDRLELDGRLQQILSFGEFDRRTYLVRYGVFGSVKQIENVAIHLPDRPSIIRVLYALRAHMGERLSRLFPDPDHGLAIGMLLGETKYFTKVINDDFRTTGLTHIVALSGFNITILLVTVQRLFIGLGRRRVFGLSLVIVITFVVLTGASASLTRAAIMGLLFALAPLIGRQHSAFVIVSLAATVMAVANPLIVPHDVAFQLSFLATLGLMAASTFFDRILSWLPPVVREPIATTLAAQVFVLPILVETFHQISLVAPLTNALILPAVPLIMLGAFVAWSISYLWWWPAIIVSWVTSFLIHWVYGVAHFFAQLPWAVWEGKDSFGWWWGVYFALMSLFFWWWSRRHESRSMKHEAKTQ